VLFHHQFMAMLCGEDSDYTAPMMGDALSSGATADPSFWPVHPNVDRAYQWRRLRGMTGEDLWPYGAVESAEFYWGGGEGRSCWGHMPDNTMIWNNLGFLHDPVPLGEYYTVKDLWLMNDPDTGHLPYAYPNFEWKACEAEGYPIDLKWKGIINDDDGQI
jgi:hypothetical protein